MSKLQMKREGYIILGIYIGYGTIRTILGQFISLNRMQGGTISPCAEAPRTRNAGASLVFN